MSDQRWGVLGTGFIAGMFAQDLSLTDTARITAVGSRSIDRAKAFADAQGAAAAYGSYEELVADPDVDFVYVAVPHSEHRRVAELAIRAGKPVLVEKPFTLNAADAEALFSLARESGVFIMEGMWSRFLPHMVEVRRLLDSGVIGDVVSVIADHGLRFDPTHPEHRLYDRALGGGALLDLGIYAVALVAGVLGDDLEIKALGTLTSTGVDAESSAVIRDEAGRHGVVTTSLSSELPNRASINGTAGRIELGYNYMIPTDLRVVKFGEGNPAGGADFTDFSGSVDGGLGWRFQALEVARCVAAGEAREPRRPSRAHPEDDADHGRDPATGRRDV